MPRHSNQNALRVTAAPDISGRRSLAPAAGRLIQAAAWAVRHPREPFALPAPRRPDRLFYRSSDGWECPLHRYPPPAGSDGAPVILAHGHVTGPEGFELAESGGLVDRLHTAGHDVYLLTHRGDRGTLPPTAKAGFDFDDIVERDVPAAIARVKQVSGAGRVLWVGHSLGGQLAVAHLARTRGRDIAAAALLCTPVRFAVPRSHARLAHLTASLLPERWRIPAHAVHQALAPFSDLTAPLAAAAMGAEGATVRAMMVHGIEDVSTGMVKQVARWLTSGSLCDRDDRLDYTCALRGGQSPLWVLACEGDRLSPPSASKPIVESSPDGHCEWTVLGSRWGHLDPLIGRDAPGQVHAPLASWLHQHRSRCWNDLGDSCL